MKMKCGESVAAHVGKSGRTGGMHNKKTPPKKRDQYRSVIQRKW